MSLLSSDQKRSHNRCLSKMRQFLHLLGIINFADLFYLNVNRRVASLGRKLSPYYALSHEMLLECASTSRHPMTVTSLASLFHYLYGDALLSKTSKDVDSLNYPGWNLCTPHSSFKWLADCLTAKLTLSIAKLATEARIRAARSESLLSRPFWPSSQPSS